MAQNFTSLRIDPIAGTEILDILGLSTYDLDNPKKYSMIREVVEFYKGQNARGSILRILSKQPYMDKLDAIWTYVQLQKEKQEKLQQLEPTDFEPDIEEQLKAKYLTKDNLKRVKDEIFKKLQEERKRQARQEREDQEYEENKNKALGKVKLESINESLSQVEVINKALEFYE